MRVLASHNAAMAPYLLLFCWMVVSIQMFAYNLVEYGIAFFVFVLVNDRHVPRSNNHYNTH